MQKWRQWEAASEAEWGLALEREAVIRPLAEQGKVSVGDVEMATRQLRIGRSVLYDLVNRYRRRPQTSSLLPWKRGRDGKLNFLEPDREQLLNACIDEFYLTPERPSLAALVGLNLAKPQNSANSGLTLFGLVAAVRSCSM